MKRTSQPTTATKVRAEDAIPGMKVVFHLLAGGTFSREIESVDVDRFATIRYTDGSCRTLQTRRVKIETCQAQYQQKCTRVAPSKHGGLSLIHISEPTRP